MTTDIILLLHFMEKYTALRKKYDYLVSDSKRRHKDLQAKLNFATKEASNLLFENEMIKGDLAQNNKWLTKKLIFKEEQLSRMEEQIGQLLERIEELKK